MLVCSELALLNEFLPNDLTNLLENGWLHLFNANLAPDKDTTLATFLANESAYTGYAVLQVTGWGAPGLVGGLPTSVAPFQDFLAGIIGTADDVYGYFYCDPSDSILLFSEQDPAAPFAMDATGKIYRVTLKWQGTSI